MDDALVYDYIIVGAGSAGCVLAERLSRDGRASVLVVEAGGHDWNPFVHMPAGLAQLMKFDSLNWNYETEPQTALDGRRLWWPRGKLLGGSSSINAMCYIRGHRADYDAWAAAGNPGWDYASLLPYFRQSEANTRGADAFHGDAGLLGVDDLRHVNPLSEVFIAAAQAAGQPYNPDFNGAEQQGFGLYQVTQREGRRCSTAAGYLSEARKRSNLHLLAKAQVTRLLLRQDRVVGIEVVRRGRVEQLHCDREVLLCGGAINSPQVLMLSGIGPAAELRRHGIPVRVDAPGVGQNLQDHLDICVLTHCTQPITYDQTNEARVALEYLLTRSGVGSSNIAEAGGFARTALARDGRPDVQFHFVPAFLDNHGRNRLPGHGYTVHCCQLRPHSRGHIGLHSADPLAKPRIQPNYLSAPEDLPVLLAGLRLSREILAAAPFAPYCGGELYPGVQAQTDAELSAFIRAKAETIYHPVGTCRMGSDAGAVVDPQLRVNGVSGLRVVDASIMPTLIGGNTNAPVVAIAEKAADAILAAAAQPLAA